MRSRRFFKMEEVSLENVNFDYLMEEKEKELFEKGLL